MGISIIFVLISSSYLHIIRTGSNTCRSSRPEYDERVCLTSGSDGVLLSVEYRLHVGRDQSQDCPVFQVSFYAGKGTVSMKLVTIRTDLLDKYSCDCEVLSKSKRPYVLIIRLAYKGHFHNFAVPIRSNISPSTPKQQYFSLPPRVATRPHHHHGIHYIKMFPVTKQYLIRYRIEGNVFASLIQTIIDRNSQRIISECQQYLDDYAAGKHPAYSTDIDCLLTRLYENP